MLKISHPNDVQVNATIDDIRLRSLLTTNKTKKFTIKYLLQYYVLLNQLQVRGTILQKDTFNGKQVHIKVEGPIIQLDVIKFIKNVIIVMDLL